MNFILNLLWLFFGGLSTALLWMLAGVLMFLTIIGIPWARATFNIGVMTLWPFGSRGISRESVSGSDLGTGPLGFLGNIIWFVLAGWWLFLYHLGCALVLAVTIIGIPFAVQYVKLAMISLAPVGKTIVWK
ncbi:MAG: YccF domain-containing protein [Bdellovibrionaceae bacterium]|nr:YccF domain-containing protein [Pseudobdellovibrionaceae bacterium]MBX3033971.1 YccF domain-containing protein [Pseudobdellovibrionaceae bacterium]